MSNQKELKEIALSASWRAPSSSEKIIKEAMKAVELLKNLSGVDELIEIFKNRDTSYPVREATAKALVELKATRAIEVFFEEYRWTYCGYIVPTRVIYFEMVNELVKHGSESQKQEWVKIEEDAHEKFLERTKREEEQPKYEGSDAIDGYNSYDPEYGAAGWEQ